MIWITIKPHIHLSKQRALLHPLTPNTVVKGCKSCSYKLVTGNCKDMKTTFFLILTFFSIILFGQTNSKHVYVEPYTRSDGTTVQGHMRTAPNSTNTDNFSTIPNVNPYTGKPGYIIPDNNPMTTPSSPNYNSTYTYPSTNSFDNLPLDFFNTKNSAYSSYPLYMVNTRANLRSEMSAKSVIIDVLTGGETVRVINSFFGDWWEVYYDGKTGYIFKSLLSFYSEGQKEVSYSNIENDPLDFLNRKIPYSDKPTYYTKGNINLREQMSTQSAILRKIPAYSSVKVISSFFGDWWEIYYDGSTGYVASYLLTK